MHRNYQFSQIKLFFSFTGIDLFSGHAYVKMQQI